MRELSFEVEPVSPFRLELGAWAIRRRASNIVDRWDGRAYRRAIVLEGHAVELETVQVGSIERPTLVVTARGERLPPQTRGAAIAVLERVLGLGVDMQPFYRLAKRDPHLRELADRFRGLKPPRFPSVFEAVVNGIACQQLSLSVGIVLLNRLASCCAPAVGDGVDPPRAFPRAQDVAGLHPGRLRELGYSHHKATALLSLARAVESGLDLEALQSLDDGTAIEQLEALRGVGRWTAEYVLLRGLGRIHLFPGDDVGARTNLARWMKLRKPLDYDRVRRLSHRWDPYAGLLYFHLLLQSLDEAGRLGGQPAAIGAAGATGYRGPPCPSVASSSISTAPSSTTSGTTTRPGASSRPPSVDRSTRRCSSRSTD
jgi:DNA-3-methyladenine glycosylase II